MNTFSGELSDLEIEVSTLRMDEKDYTHSMPVEDPEITLSPIIFDSYAGTLLLTLSSRFPAATEANQFQTSSTNP